MRARRLPLSAPDPRSGNPGPSGAGAVLLAPGGGGALAQACTWLGHATNNEAEYQALISGLRLAARVPAVRRLLVEGGAPLSSTRVALSAHAAQTPRSSRGK